MIYLYTDEVSIIIKGYSAKAISNDKEWLEETIADTFDSNDYSIGHLYIKKIEEVNNERFDILADLERIGKRIKNLDDKILVDYTDDGFYSWNEILIRTIGELQKEELTKDMYIDGNYDSLFNQNYEEFVESFDK